MIRIFYISIFIIFAIIVKGQSWSAVGAGTDSLIYCLSSDTANNLIYAGGMFSNAGGISAKNVAKWNGSNWLPLGNGANNKVCALAMFNGELYAGGSLIPLVESRQSILQNGMEQIGLPLDQE